MKCDIVGSTRLKRTLDLDGQLEFKRCLETTITEVAARHAGHVEQFEGDGALVFFGYPEAREDARRVRRVHGASTSSRRSPSAHFAPALQMQIRVGIASGPLAIVRERHVARGEPYVGLIIDMAERLRALAEPDTS